MVKSNTESDTIHSNSVDVLLLQLKWSTFALFFCKKKPVFFNNEKLPIFLIFKSIDINIV